VVGSCSPGRDLGCQDAREERGARSSGLGDVVLGAAPSPLALLLPDPLADPGFLHGNAWPPNNHQQIVTFQPTRGVGARIEEDYGRVALDVVPATGDHRFSDVAGVLMPRAKVLVRAAEGHKTLPAGHNGPDLHGPASQSLTTQIAMHA
jgi:hypothetical protein